VTVIFAPGWFTMFSNPTAMATIPPMMPNEVPELLGLEIH